MKRGHMIRIIINLAWYTMPYENAKQLLDHYNLTEGDIKEFLYLGEQAINDIDEMFASNEPA